MIYYITVVLAAALSWCNPLPTTDDTAECYAVHWIDGRGRIKRTAIECRVMRPDGTWHQWPTSANQGELIQ